MKICGIKSGRTITSGRFNQSPGVSIDKKCKVLKDNGSLQVSIEGHTDNVGMATANQKLSEDRANSVMNAIVKGGVDKTRLVAKEWGANQTYCR